MNRLKRERLIQRANDAEDKAIRWRMKVDRIERDLSVQHDQNAMLTSKYERLRSEHERINELVIRAMTPSEQSAKGLSYDVESIVDELLRLRVEIDQTKADEEDRRLEAREEYDT
jgi:hypothetical protein